jgi:hypothetical protein
MFIVLEKWEGQQDQRIILEGDDEQEIMKFYKGYVSEAKKNKTPVTYEFKEIKGISHDSKYKDCLAQKAKDKGATSLILMDGKIYDDTNLPIIKQVDEKGQ